MEPASETARRRELNAFIEAYESAQARDGQADLADFLPAPGHPLRAAVLRELVRVDLEYGWERGQPRPVQDYLRQFPELATDETALRAVAFEEYRLWQQAGDDPAPAEYQRLYGGRASDWPRPAREAPPARDFQPDRGAAADLDSWGDSRADAKERSPRPGELPHSDPEVAYLLAQALTAMPEVGTSFAGFRLVAELGSGAFGRVYLARQGDLANRLVALKISVDLLGESQTLAQLQHTNIVPIYSVHQAGPFQAVCMPYFGPTTLADVLKDLQGDQTLPESGSRLVQSLRACQAKIAGRAARQSGAPAPPILPETAGDATATLKMLEESSHVRAVLWIGLRLAEGLAHAHEHGILHQDLKPANILLTDEGQPMLLDFNLSADTKRRTGISTAQIGGTLPYMSPEHLAAFRGEAHAVDARSDLYSLGVILHELLTGRLPFEVRRGPLAEVLPRLLEERRRRVGGLRRWNRAVSPAVESIVRHCLEPEPGRRYQTAQELRTDLQCQLEHSPLRFAAEPSLGERARKWVRRHPRLASPAALGALAVLALGLAVAGIAWRVRKDAQREQQRAEAEKKQAGTERRLAAEKARRATEQTRRARQEAARARQEAARADAKQKAHRQYQRFDAEVGQFNHFEDRLNLVELLDDTQPMDHQELAEDVRRCRDLLGRYRVLDEGRWQDQPAVRDLPAAEREQLRKRVGKLLHLLCRATLRREDPKSALPLNALAQACYEPDQVPRALLTQRSQICRLLGDRADAGRWQARAEKLHPVTAEERYQGAADQAVSGRLKDAILSLKKVVRDWPQSFSPQFLLALCHQKRQAYAEARACYSACIALRPDFPDGYFQRGWLDIRQKHWADAEADFTKVLKLRPRLASAYLQRAGARHGREDEEGALADLEQALQLRPGYIEAHLLRAAVHQSQGDHKAAKRDRQAVLDSRPVDAEDWTLRGQVRAADDPPGALADFNEALRLNARYRPALFHKAQVLSNLRGRNREALRVLDRLIALYPDYALARVKRGFLQALLDRWPEAHKDAEEALYRQPTPAMHYEAACVFAQTTATHPGDRHRAFQLLLAALRQGYPLPRLAADPKLAPLRRYPEFRELQRVVQVLNAASPEESLQPN
jgi:serine/threonine protein kinase/tetratricopeptide (TPR) repeat protein